MSTLVHTPIRTLVAVLAVIGLTAACGGAGGEVALEAGATATEETVAVATTTSSTVPTSVDETQAPEPEVRPFGERTLTAGLYRTTMTDPVILFEVPDHGDDIRWFGRLQTPWSVTMILFSDLTPRGEHEPGVTIAVAETGSTIDSVVSAMQASDPSGRYSFAIRDGSFSGRQAAIVTMVSNRTGDRADIVQIGTGEESYMNAMYAADRQLEVYVYEIDGRIAIVNFEAPTSQVDMIAAEGGAIVESLVIGESS